MAGENYNIPFGVDLGNFFKGMADMESRVDRAGVTISETGKDLQAAFSQASAGGEKLAKAIEADAAAVKILREQAKQAGKELGDALSGKGIGTGFETKLADIKKRLQSIATSSTQVDISFDEKKVQLLEQQIKKASTATGEFNVILNYAKQQLSTLDPAGGAFHNLSVEIESAEQMIKRLNTDIEDTFVQLDEDGNPLKDLIPEETVTKTQSLRAELRTVREEMARLELAGQGTSAEFLNLQRRGGELTDQIGDVSQRVKALASDTAGLDAGIAAVQGLAGAFAAGQGAMALFGEENEEAEKVIQKVTGALAVLQGVQSIANALNKDSALMVVILNALRGKQVATVAAETTAEVANTAATVTNTAATQGAVVATTAWTAALLLNPIVLITAAIVLGVTAILQYASATDEAADAAERFNKQLDIEKQYLDDNLSALNRDTQRRAADAKLRGANESELTKIELSEVGKQIKIRKEYEVAIEKTMDKIEDLHRKGELDEEDYNNKIQNSIKELAENSEALLDLDVQAHVKSTDATIQVHKERLEAEKKATADRLANAAKEAELQRKIRDQILKFTRELTQERVEAMAEGVEKEKAVLQNQVKQQIENLNSEKALTKQAANIRAEAIAQINKNLTEDLKKIDLEAAKERIALLVKVEQELTDMQVDGVEKEIRILQLGAISREAEIRETYKNETELRDKLIKSLYEKTARDEAKLIRENAATRMNTEEQTELLGIELMSKYAVESKDVEEAKQIELLKIQLKYAKMRAVAIVDDGTDTSNLLKLQAEKQIKDLEKALNTAVDNHESKGFDLFKLLGLGDLSDKQKEAVKSAAQSSLDSLTEITDFIVDQYQRQIDKRQEAIDQADEEISDLEDKLDAEKELRENGFANNVAVIEGEIAARKRARDEEIKQQQDYQKKQAAVQRAQIAIDSITQASNLITAGTDIFKSLAKIPFVGVPLAIATIALMTGAFITSKVKMFQAVSEGQKLERGGLVTGKSHREGGQKYVSLDGTGGVVELEGGEHVTRKKQVKKYEPLLNAINEDRLDQMSEGYLKDFLSGMGITLNTDVQKQAINEVKQRDETRLHILAVGGGGSDMSEISENVAFLAKKAKDKTERWEDDFYRYEMKAGIRKRTKKKTEF